MVVARCTARLEETSIAARRVETELQARIDDLYAQVGGAMDGQGI